MADVLGERTIALTGHKTRAVFEVYSSHATERQLREPSKSVATVFAAVLPAREATA